MAQEATRCWRWLVIATVLCAPLVATGQTESPAAADSLATAAPDTTMATTATDTALVPVPPPPVPDFFDTGIDGTAAILMTPVMPGWGQLYAENGWRAMLSFGAQWWFWSRMLARDRQAVRFREHAQLYPSGSDARTELDALADEYYELMRDYAWWSGAILLIVALDAYVGAGLYGFDEEPIPVPNRFDEYFDTGVPEPPGSRGAPQLVVFQWGRKF